MWPARVKDGWAGGGVIVRKMSCGCHRSMMELASLFFILGIGAMEYCIQSRGGRFVGGGIVFAHASLSDMT